MLIPKSIRPGCVVAFIIALGGSAAQAWDQPGHSIINRLALDSLPSDFPAFVREPANVERIAFLSGEPDRWSHSPDLPLKNSAWGDHFLDVEQIPLAGLDFAEVPSLRYEFAIQFAAARAAHPDKFPPIDLAKDADRTREWCGFLPWAVVEFYGKLRSAFASLKAYEEFGTPAEVANARTDVVDVMGLMGHFVGDSAQPLHTTIHHAGWVGDNPNGYTTWPGIHTWIDSGLIAKAGITVAEMVPRVVPARVVSVAARPDGRDPVFVAELDFILAQNKLVEPLYQLEKRGKLGHGGQTVSREARAFVDGQLLKGGEMLGALWLTAWRNVPVDSYLRGQLLKRKTASATAP